MTGLTSKTEAGDEEALQDKESCLLERYERGCSEGGARGLFRARAVKMEREGGEL